ncbi:MAG: hypothetical protein ACK55I_37630 [bacterium]
MLQPNSAMSLLKLCDSGPAGRHNLCRRRETPEQNQEMTKGLKGRQNNTSESIVPALQAFFISRSLSPGPERPRQRICRPSGPEGKRDCNPLTANCLQQNPPQPMARHLTLSS